MDNRQTKIQISETREMAKIGMGQSIFEGASRIERTYHLAGFEGEGDYNFKVGSRLIELKVGAGSAEEIATQFQSQLKKKWCIWDSVGASQRDSIDRDHNGL